MNIQHQLFFELLLKIYTVVNALKFKKKKKSTQSVLMKRYSAWEREREREREQQQQQHGYQGYVLY